MTDPVTISGADFVIKDAAGKQIWPVTTPPPQPGVTIPVLTISTPDGTCDNATPQTIKGTIDVANVGLDIVLHAGPTYFPVFKAAGNCEWTYTTILKDVGKWELIASATNAAGTGNSNVLTMNVMQSGTPVPPDPQPPSGTNAPPNPQTQVAVGEAISSIQTKINNCPSGGSVVFAAGAYPAGNLRLKAGVTLWANGSCTMGGSFDGSSLAGWVIAGRDPGQGFVLSGGSRINASGASNYVVACCTFNGQTSNGYNGSAVMVGSSRGGVIVNNLFAGCQGNTIGMYYPDQLTLDGNVFTNNRQSISFQFKTDQSCGNKMYVWRNTFTGNSRAAM